MNKVTLLSVYDTCRGRQFSIVASRPKGNFGVAVNDDPKAREWQRLDRIADKCLTRIAIKCCDGGRGRLTAADALAVGVDELLEMLEDDELTPDSVLEPIRVLLREYREDA